MPNDSAPNEFEKEGEGKNSQPLVSRPLKQTALTSLWVAMVLVLVDQLTKYWAVSTLTFAEPVAVMPYLNWTLIYNYGAAFSFLADMGGWQRWFFSGVALIVSVVFIIWLSRLPKGFTTEVWGINLILGGAIGGWLYQHFGSGGVAGQVTSAAAQWLWCDDCHPVAGRQIFAPAAAKNGPCPWRLSISTAPPPAGYWH